MFIIGIDPGISGAISFLNNGEIVDVIDMPHMADGKKNKKQVILIIKLIVILLMNF